MHGESSRGHLARDLPGIDERCSAGRSRPPELAREILAALTDPKYNQNTVAVASSEGTLIGIAMSGPTLDNADEPQQLHLIYAYAAFHGSGVGTALLNAVIDPTAPAALWVADPNPRAQAFYRKNGFVTNGEVKTEDDVREVRMVRTIQELDAR